MRHTGRESQKLFSSPQTQHLLWWIQLRLNHDSWKELSKRELATLGNSEKLILCHHIKYWQEYIDAYLIRVTHLCVPNKYLCHEDHKDSLSACSSEMKEHDKRSSSENVLQVWTKFLDLGILNFSQSSSTRTSPFLFWLDFFSKVKKVSDMLHWSQLTVLNLSHVLAGKLTLIQLGSCQRQINCCKEFEIFHLSS